MLGRFELSQKLKATRTLLQTCLVKTNFQKNLHATPKQKEPKTKLVRKENAKS